MVSAHSSVKQMFGPGRRRASAAFQVLDSDDDSFLLGIDNNLRLIEAWDAPRTLGIVS
jgi:hypothetical protein